MRVLKFELCSSRSSFVSSNQRRAIVLALILCFCVVCLQPVMANTQRTLLQIIQTQGEIAGVKYLEDRVEANDVEAIHLLVKYYVQRGNAKQKLDVIVKLLGKGAELNDVRSLYLLGNIYSDGLFASPNIDLARQYYQRAAATGHIKSQDRLAQMPEVEPFKVAPPAKNDTPKAEPKQTVPIPTSQFPPGYSNQTVTWVADRLEPHRIRGFGSGFALSSEGVIATNEHVIDGCKEIFAVYQSKPKRAQLLFANKAHDFAVVKISAKTPSFFFLKSSAPLLGEELTSGGYPSPDTLGAGIKITTGVVSSEGPRTGEQFQHTTPSQPGNSGGPLINSAGYVVGISTAVYGENIGELAPQNINFAVSEKTIRHNLKKWNLRFSEGTDSLHFPTTLLADMLKRSTAQIICY